MNTIIINGTPIQYSGIGTPDVSLVDVYDMKDVSHVSTKYLPDRDPRLPCIWYVAQSGVVIIEKCFNLQDELHHDVAPAIIMRITNSSEEYTNRWKGIFFENGEQKNDTYGYGECCPDYLMNNF